MKEQYTNNKHNEINDKSHYSGNKRTKADTQVSDRVDIDSYQPSAKKHDDDPEYNDDYLNNSKNYLADKLTNTADTLKSYDINFNKISTNLSNKITKYPIRFALAAVVTGVLLSKLFNNYSDYLLRGGSK